MDFVSERIKNMTFDRPRCVGRSNVEVAKAVPVRALFECALREDPLPSMKSYSFMPQAQIDLNVRVPDVHSHAQLVELAKRNEMYNADKAKYEDEQNQAKLNQEKEDEKARIIAEYEASKSSQTSVEPSGEAQ